MGWGITLNKTHVTQLKRALIVWLGFVACGLIFGAHLKPRPDEIAFMILLPIPFVAVYAVGCLALAILRILWPIRRDWHTRPVLRLFSQAHQRIRYGSR